MSALAPTDTPAEATAPVCGWMKLFHPSGVLVTLPVPGAWREKGRGYDYAAAFSAVSDAIGCGFTVNAPGLEAGEQKEEVGYVCRCEKENKDKTTSPHIHLYSPNDAVVYKVLSVYLNNEEDQAAFERASGLTLDKLTVFPGSAAPKRGENRTSDKFIVKAPRPFAVVLTANPKYDEKEAEAFAARKETYKVPKRLFVRWADQPADPVERPKVDTTSTVVHQPTLDEWAKFLATQPDAERINERYAGPEYQGIACKYTFREVRKLLNAYVESEGIEFDLKTKKFVGPKDVAEEPGYDPF